MGCQESTTEIFEKFTWKIENYSRLNDEKIYSELCILGGYLWRIVLYPKGNKYSKMRDAVNQLSIYLEAMKTANMSEGWSRDVKIKLAVFNQLDTNMTIAKETRRVYNVEDAWGFTTFMSLTELCNPEKGFIVKDACIVGAEIFVCNSSHEKQVNQADNSTVSPVSIKPTKEVDEELLYAAILGRVIILLQTSKVKDMNDKTCKELQVLWDQLKNFKFDLSWLEPHVESALGMKSYVEKALQVEKLKENVLLSELETDLLKAKLASAEVNLEIERGLLKAKGVKERDLDSEIWRP